MADINFFPLEVKSNRKANQNHCRIHLYLRPKVHSVTQSYLQRNERTKIENGKNVFYDIWRVW